jgi:hypothetical protein
MTYDPNDPRSRSGYPSGPRAGLNGTWMPHQRHMQETLSAVDLPLNFHPAAIRASANVTPFGAVSVPA